MVRKLLTLLLMLCFAQASFAQIAPSPTEIKPPDMPSYSPVVPTWKTDGTQNNPINPVTTPPPFAGLTEVNPTNGLSGRTITDAFAGATFQGYISGTTLTVTGGVVGTITNGDVLYVQSSSAALGSINQGSGEQATVTFVSGTAGGVGTYSIGLTQSSIGSSGTPANLGTTNPNFCLTTYSNGPCPQAKFRSVSNCTRVLNDDPLKGYGQPGTSHTHEFFGNLLANAYTTYASTRNKPAAHSAGYDLNGTDYWFTPPIIKNAFGDGKDYAVKCSLVTLYYQEDLASNGPLDTLLVPGLQYIFGRNMEDPDNSMLQKIIYGLNQSSASNRYRLIDNTGRFNTQGVYNCLHSGVAYTSYVIVNADGTDPFGGHCVNGDDFWVGITGAGAWDGVNPWSPGGMNHVIKQIYDGAYGIFAPPYNYYRIPFLHQEIHFTQQGFSDFQRWRLSADDPMQTKLDSLPICASDFSNSPCANGATFNGHISGTTLTVNSVSVGAMCQTTTYGTIGELGPNGYQIEGSGITGHPIIESGPTSCQTGTYTLGGSFSCSGACASDGTLRASEYVANGMSIHEDWKYGWDKTTADTWQINCIGAMGHTPHECNSSQIDATHALLGSGVGSTLPDGFSINQTPSAYPTNSPSNMFVVPSQMHGMETMCVHGTGTC